MIRSALAAAAAALLCAAPAAAQTAASREGAEHWRALTRLDLEAAYALVSENHPAAVRELGDTAFQAALDAAIRRARERADKVEGITGYVAVLNGFATDLGDKHIWSRQVFRPAAYHWTGLAVARRGGTWRVVDDARGASPSLAGATLIGCDGRSADAIAEERIGGFRAVWSIEAQRIQNAPWILIDDGNPLLQRPKACEFELNGARSTTTLTWTPIGGSGLSSRITKAVSVGHAGFGVRKVGEGYWISIEGLDQRAQAVIDAVKADASAIRQAPFVVLDMRGNGGGNSGYGDSLAAELMGQGYLRRAQNSGSTAECTGPWRASPGNLRNLQAFMRDQAPNLAPELVAYMRRETELMERAIAEGRPFNQPVVACPGAESPSMRPLDGKGSQLKGRMILLTDNACFSSCLLVTDLFRRLGALHVGEATDAATRYMEVREELLPSGMGYFSTLQKVSLGSPRQIGPFAPSQAFQGDIADTAALEAWIQQIAR